VVAGELRPALRHQKLRGFAGKERPRQAVAEVHDRVGAAPSDIHQHRLERGEVAVDVGEDGETHDQTS